MPGSIILHACWMLLFSCVLSTGLLTPAVMWLASRLGVVDRGGFRKIYDGIRPMPLMGGLGIAIPVLAVCALLWIRPTLLLGASPGPLTGLIALVAGSVIILGLGVVDDAYGLSALPKFLVQIAVSLLVCMYGVSIDTLELPGMGKLILGPEIGVLFTVIWFVGVMNAFNLIDGLDGLSAGISLVGTLGLMALAVIGGNSLVIVLCAALAGSLIAFLIYNFHPAKIFLGDTGSMFLGFVLAMLALLLPNQGNTVTFWPASVLVLGVPIFETLLSMMRRAFRGQPIFTGDKHHTHHRLLARGFPQPQAVLVLYSAAIFFAGAAVTSQLIPRHAKAALFAMAFFLEGAACILWPAGYIISLQAVWKMGADWMMKHRRRNSIFAAFAKYAIKSLRANAANLDQILATGCMELHLFSLAIISEEDGAPLAASIAQETGKAGTADKTIEQILVMTTDGGRMIIRYRHQYEPDTFERQDVAACLVSIFERTSLTQLARLAGSEKGEEEQADGCNIVEVGGDKMEADGEGPQARAKLKSAGAKRRR